MNHSKSSEGEGKEEGRHVTARVHGDTSSGKEPGVPAVTREVGRLLRGAGALAGPLSLLGILLLLLPAHTPGL